VFRWQPRYTAIEYYCDNGYNVTERALENSLVTGDAHLLALAKEMGAKHVQLLLNLWVDERRGISTCLLKYIDQTQKLILAGVTKEETLCKYVSFLFLL